MNSLYVPYDNTSFFHTEDDRYLSIERELDPINPREYSEGLGTFLTWQNHYISPDENPYATPADFVEDMLGEEKAATCQTMQDVLGEFDEAGFLIRGIYRFEHGNVTYQLGESNPFSDQWDSGAVGFAFVSPDKLAKEGISKEGALSILESEMKQYDAFVDGETFCVTVFDQDGEETDRYTLYGLDEVEIEFPYLEEIPVQNINDLVDYLQAQMQGNEPSETFYFSFGSSERFPFQNGWVEVMAEDQEKACDLFRSHFPGRNKTLNCAFVYNAQEWRDTPMAQGGAGQVCHQVINAPGPYHSEPSQLLGELIKQIKQRTTSKNSEHPKHASERKSPEIGL